MRHIKYSVFVLLFFAGFVYSQSGKRDGNWWIRQDYNSNLNYITCFFDGIELSHDFSCCNLIDSSRKGDSRMFDAIALYRRYLHREK
jgi:hypothetical protein